MFNLLSKKTNIFSVPVYIGILFAIMLVLNELDFLIGDIFSFIIAFLGIGLGYFLFDKINLTRKTYLPLFLYTFFIFIFYKDGLDIGISMALFTNSILLFLLTNDDEILRKNSFLLIGNLLAVSYIFLPTSWTFFIFVILHIIFTSDKVFLNIFQLILGSFFIFLGWFCVMYILEQEIISSDYIPLIYNEFIKDFSPLYPLLPTLIITIMAIMDHFLNYSKKNPTSRFKYSFILAFLIVQTLILVLYMGSDYEYILLISFPISIILSRFLRFLKYYWMQELGLWIIIISCLFFKFNPIFNLI